MAQANKTATPPSLATLQVPATQAQGFAPQATYKLGKPYNPRTNTQNGNAVLFAAVRAHLAANGGKATGAALWQAVLAVPITAGGVPHYQYMGYMVRRAWLVAA